MDKSSAKSKVAASPGWAWVNGPFGESIPVIVVVRPDGSTITAEVREGQNLMEAAVAANVPRVIGECGGSLSCATCHVYIEPDWVEKVGARNPMEEDMLDFAFDVRDNSRLSCQIKVSDALDGLTRALQRIRQIESKTMSKLRHPSRSQVLRDYLD